MGRTNPKLAPFLRLHLEMECFMNLKYEDDDAFYVDLPRFDKEKCGKYEEILKAWYDFNGKSHKYVGYSNGKSVFQAALKKSVYLMPLPRFGKRLRFRFATDEEVKEKKRLLREKSKKDVPPAIPLDPPSVASSGYQSGSDSDGENFQMAEMQIPEVFWNDVLDNPEKYIGDCDPLLDDLFNDINDIDMEDAVEKLPPQNIQLDELKPPEQPQIVSSVTELKTTPVGVPGSVKKYWLCTQKIKVKATLQLICELQIIENENTGIKEGSVVIPNDVFEPGISYELKKFFELNDMQYYFFTPNSA